MGTFIKGFFMVLGVIFFLILCAGFYVWFADPFGIRSVVNMLFSPRVNDQAVQTDASRSGAVPQGELAPEDKHPALSSEQEQALESMGIEPSNLPTTLTPEARACMEVSFGKARVAEIQAGATPSAEEVFAGIKCL